jgi:hypothetical protein
MRILTTETAEHAEVRIKKGVSPEARGGTALFSTLSKIFNLQRGIHGRNSAPSGSFSFILLSSSGWVQRSGFIPDRPKEAQAKEVRENAERRKYSLEDSCF